MLSRLSKQQLLSIACLTQEKFICSKSTVETLEKGAKYAQS